MAHVSIPIIKTFKNICVRFINIINNVASIIDLNVEIIMLEQSLDQ